MPGAGDIAVITHPITLDSDRTIGTSPSDQTTYVVDVSGGGSIIWGGPYTLTVRGNVNLNVGTAATPVNALDMGAGGQLLFDSTAATTPTTVYVLRFAAYAVLRARGSASQRCVIGGVIGGGNARTITATYENGGCMDVEFLTFIRMGTAATAGVATYPAGDSPGVRWADVLIDGCGQTYLAPKVATSTITVSNLRVVNPLNTASTAFTLRGNAGQTGVCKIEDSVLLTNVIGSPPTGWELRRVYIEGRLGTSNNSTTAYSGFKAVESIFHRNANTGVNMEMSPKDSVLVLDGNINNAGIGMAVSSFQDALWDGNVFDPVVPSYNGDWIFPSCLVPGRVSRFTRNVFLPTPTGISPGKFLSVFGQSTTGRTDTAAAFDNNTLVTTLNSGLTAIETAVGVGEILTTDYTAVDQLKSCKNNIFWTPDGKTPGYKVVQQHSTRSDIAYAASCDYNCGSNLDAGTEGKGYTKWSTNTGTMFGSGSPGAHDVDADPQFVDHTRCVATYDTDRLGNTAPAWVTGVSYSVGDVVSLATAGIYGGKTINYRCVKAHTSLAGDATNGAPLVATNWRTNWELATYQRIREDVSRIADVHQWVRAGFAPQNQALKSAGYGGVDIGAIAVYAPSPSASSSYGSGAKLKMLYGAYSQDLKRDDAEVLMVIEKFLEVVSG